MQTQWWSLLLKAHTPRIETFLIAGFQGVEAMCRVGTKSVLHTLQNSCMGAWTLVGNNYPHARKFLTQATECPQSWGLRKHGLVPDFLIDIHFSTTECCADSSQAELCPAGWSLCCSVSPHRKPGLTRKQQEVPDYRITPYCVLWYSEARLASQGCPSLVWQKNVFKVLIFNSD